MSRVATQPKQKVVYVRVTKMFLPRSNPNVARNIFQQIQPGYSGVISPLMPTRMIDMYSSSAILAFRFYDPEKSNITFIVTELAQAGENEVCRLCLPISWFPHGYVVHHYFPFITKTPQNGTPFIELDVHVADIQTPPFSAYYGTLKVIPTWTPPPQMTAGATIIVSGPIAFQPPTVPQNQQQQQQKKQETVINKPIDKTKEQNQKENDKLTIMKNKHTHHEYTPLVEPFSDDSEIMLDDLDDVLTDESNNQNPPPVINPSKSNGNQNNLQHPQQVQQSPQNTQQPQIQPQPQTQPQQLQQQQSQLQHPQQIQQLPQFQHQPQYTQPPPQYAQQPQYTQHQNSKSHKIQYPPFPPLPGQNQPSQPPQQLEHPINNGDPK